MKIKNEIFLYLTLTNYPFFIYNRNVPIKKHASIAQLVDAEVVNEERVLQRQYALAACDWKEICFKL